MISEFLYFSIYIIASSFTSLHQIYYQRFALINSANHFQSMNSMPLDLPLHLTITISFHHPIHHHHAISSAHHASVSRVAVRGRHGTVCRLVPATPPPLLFLSRHHQNTRQRLFVHAHEAELRDREREWVAVYLVNLV